MIQKRECRKSMMSTRWINIITPRFFFILIVCNQNNSKILSFGICWPWAAYREKFIIFIRTVWIVFSFFCFSSWRPDKSRTIESRIDNCIMPEFYNEHAIRSHPSNNWMAMELHLVNRMIWYIILMLTQLMLLWNTHEQAPAWQSKHLINYWKCGALNYLIIIKNIDYLRVSCQHLESSTTHSNEWMVKTHTNSKYEVRKISWGC